MKCYIPLGNCALRYKGYEYNNQKVCLRYEETLKTYHEAADVCQREGGDLIRVDSITKHNIMSAFIGKYVENITTSRWMSFKDSKFFKYGCLIRLLHTQKDMYLCIIYIHVQWKFFIYMKTLRSMHFDKFWKKNLDYAQQYNSIFI